MTTGVPGTTMPRTRAAHAGLHGHRAALVLGGLGVTLVVVALLAIAVGEEPIPPAAIVGMALQWLPIHPARTWSDVDLTIVTMVALQQMTPQAGMDPAQRRMMNIMMPVMFAGFTWAVSAGLALYWTVGTVISLAMQYSINRSALGTEIRELQEKRARKQKK